MLNKIKTYVAFFAATFNIVASALYFDAVGKWWDSTNVSGALATWFFAGSLVLWVVFIVLHASSLIKKAKK